MRSTPRRAAALAAFALATVGAGTFSVPSGQASSSSFTAPPEAAGHAPEVYRGSFFKRDVAAMLRDFGVQLALEDRVTAFPDPALGLGSELRVYRAPTVLLRDGGIERAGRTWARTVGAFLAERRADPEGDDVAVPPAATLLSDLPAPYRVTVTRVAVTRKETRESIPFTTQYVDDPKLPRGTEEVRAAGTAGRVAHTVEIRREDGREISRRTVSRLREAEPVPRVTARGTKPELLDRGSATFYRACGTGRMTAAHRTLPLGMEVDVVNPTTGKRVRAVIDDRGPFISGRIIDLSCDAFKAIGSTSSGVIEVRVERP